MRVARPLHVAGWEHAAAKPDGFTYADIAAGAGVSYQQAINVVKRWLDEGRVATVGIDEDRRILFRVTPDGQAAAAVPLVAQAPEAALWQAMRGLVKFTARELAAHIPPEVAAVDESSAQRYCAALLKAGYLKVLKKAVPGIRAASYRLIRNTGPLPPVERRTVIVQDPNLGETVYVAPVRT